MNRCAIIGLSLVVTAAAVEPIRLGPPLWIDRDDRDIPKPAAQEVSELYAIFYNSWIRHLSIEQGALASRDKGALNVNGWDEAPDSSWFTNRMGRRALSFEQILAGLEGAPPRAGAWTIEQNSNEGYTPKFRIRDGAGNRYYVKLIERNAPAERISTLVLHAAGYNVPFNSIAHFRREDLRRTDKSVYVDAIGKRRPMTPADLEEVLQKLKPAADGRYQGLASHVLAGYVGKFKYDGIRKDDPNDIIPHELRRELRGLRVIASWINHADTGDKNTADFFVPTNGERGYVKHYLLDFGSTLGSGDFTNGPYRVGHEYLFDGAAMSRTFFSFGAWRRPWEAGGRIHHPEVGYFDAALFAPERWKPNYPNLAFVRMDDADAYWGAKIVTAFSDDTIQKLAEAGEYSRPEVTRYVAATLKQRRDLIARYWLDRVSPLEEFTLSGDQIRFRDLARERGYVEASARQYQCRVDGSAPQTIPGPACTVALSGMPSSSPPDRFGRVPLARVMIRANRRDGGWAEPVEVILGRAGNGDAVQVLGWRHAPR